MRVYVDNVVASGRVTGDLPPAEMEALQEIDRAHDAGRIKRVTSRESWREQDRTRDSAKRAKLEEARCEVSVVATDHVVLGFSHHQDQYGGFIANPLVTDVVDEPLFADLKSIGLQDADARHLMYAVTNDCQRFLTLDPDFIDRRSALRARCPSIQIVTLLELAEELRGAQE
jgi:hypothetical protein